MEEELMNGIGIAFLSVVFVKNKFENLSASNDFSISYSSSSSFSLLESCWLLYVPFWESLLSAC
jgi:hypothetical protein